MFNRSRKFLRVRFVLPLVAFMLVASALGVSQAAVWVTTYYVEAETATLAAGSSVYTDATANGGKAIIFRQNGTATRQSLTPRGTNLMVRARANLCGGAPLLTIALDTQITNVSVTVTSWANYSFGVNATAGIHTFKFTYANDHWQPGVCDRNLHIDGVWLQSPDPVNTGTAGSICEATDMGAGWTAPGPGVAAWSMQGAPAYSEVGAPTGAYEGRSPKGVMMVIHGGGWRFAGPRAVASVRRMADPWRAEGWQTANVTYQGCSRSLSDVLWFYDRVEASNPGLPVCIVGESAGAHLALMIAALRPGTDCAISHGGPTDLVSIRDQLAYDPVTGGTQNSGPTRVYWLAAAAFGESNLVEMSPITYAAQIRARLLLATAATDVLIPLQQGASFVAAVKASNPVAYAEAMVLGAGTQPWVHGSILLGAVDLLDTATDTLVTPLLGGILGGILDGPLL